jgi:hypothetical protein
MDIGMLYDRPFTDLHAAGLDGLFSTTQGDALIEAIHRINNVA